VEVFAVLCCVVRRGVFSLLVCAGLCSRFCNLGLRWCGSVYYLASLREGFLDCARGYFVVIAAQGFALDIRSQ